MALQHGPGKFTTSGELEEPLGIFTWLFFISSFQSHVGIFLIASPWEPGEVSGGKAYESVETSLRAVYPQSPAVPIKMTI